MVEDGSEQGSELTYSGIGPAEIDGAIQSIDLEPNGEAGASQEAWPKFSVEQPDPEQAVRGYYVPSRVLEQPETD